ncbi:hypothetical protein L228DRAFT_266214 [Xylona heveae TC161]|uniref:C2H2-type domain-containing protein n=1 Tax=Xylona heveae (strain CBS 132557 / TC161) TaxID=1328760 RepID=A0A165J5K4_XYLHT|nr:hypothetical protein L228DRAFT_266214 [Xylona heveae TC161]KZF25760.1 hypothetical protein L228DRAFT_266214 [Xylona heveae TC161]
MDVPRVTAVMTPSIRVCDFNAQTDPFRRPSLAYSATVHSSSSGPMSIPNAREPAPPALPPPRYLDDLAHGSDPGWQWGNRDTSGGFAKGSFGSVNPSSSLCGGSSFRRPWADADQKPVRRESSTSTIVAPTRDLEMAEPGSQLSARELPAPLLAVPTNCELKGERQLEQRNSEEKSKDYDKRLLSRIGNPNTPPRNHRSPPITDLNKDVSPTSGVGYVPSSRQPVQLRALSLPEARAAAPESSLYRWKGFTSHSAGMSPAGVSPSGYPSHGGFTDSARTPSTSHPVSYMSEVDPFARIRGGEVRRSGSGSTYFDDVSSIASRSNRGSYDRESLVEPETEFPMDESGMRNLRLGDRTPPNLDGPMAALCRAGQKRRASSPPREVTRDDKLSVSSASGLSDGLGLRRLPGLVPPPVSSGSLGPPPLLTRTSPVSRTHPNHGSVSSVSSYGARNGSYASTTSLSLGGSSITSLSSSYASLDRTSPRGISPLSELDSSHDSPYFANSVASFNPSPRGSLSRSNRQRTMSETKTNAATTAPPPPPPPSSSSSLPGMPAPAGDIAASSQAKQPGAPRLQGHYICECCPKKPKKFDTAEELQLHAMEKQYTCQYCQNRFKNKNEAERHQNSLHLRRHSWSCAALSGVETAFHPSSTMPSAADVCGYCGEEFPNPAQWDVRVEHLTSVHKYGECNQSKKFFRADHFRQHLKHSHAGTSGKWTNMLENACMKEEPLPEVLNSSSSSAPVTSTTGGSATAPSRGSISMPGPPSTSTSAAIDGGGGGSGSGISNGTRSGLVSRIRGAVINEVHDES